MFVETRGVTSASMLVIGIAPVVCSWREPSSCANEFHALQSGQRPSHFGDWLPHSEQEKTAAFFATKQIV